MLLASWISCCNLSPSVHFSWTPEKCPLHSPTPFALLTTPQHHCLKNSVPSSPLIFCCLPAGSVWPECSLLYFIWRFVYLKRWLNSWALCDPQPHCFKQSAEDYSAAEEGRVSLSGLVVIMQWLLWINILELLSLREQESDSGKVRSQTSGGHPRLRLCNANEEAASL